jgi:hypothetical protein
VSRPPILGQLHPDLACAVALGLVEYPRVIANLDAVTLHDQAMRPLGTVRNWLDGNDPLDVATREYLAARRDVAKAVSWRPGQTGWAAASATRARDEANKRAIQARDLARGLLAERGVLAYARKAGLKLLGVD